MSEPSADDALIALGTIAVGVGVGLVIGAVVASVERRRLFAQLVREQLVDTGVELVASELGRDAKGAVWVLTVRLPSGQVGTFHLPVAGDAFAPTAASSAVNRVLAYLRSHALLAA